MCGICGIFFSDRDWHVTGDVLAGMNHRIVHRGPDDEGHFIENTIGFYHKRLSIIDLASGHQPMTTNNHVIVFNGEIYNYIELRDDLKRKGHAFRTNSDTEVILKMYEEYGCESINQLNGMFSFLIYDKIRNQIVAARDHFGIKPLYFFKNDECILFASEIKALLEHPAVAAEVNKQGLHDYLTFQFESRVIGPNGNFHVRCVIWMPEDIRSAGMLPTFSPRASFQVHSEWVFVLAPRL